MAQEEVTAGASDSPGRRQGPWSAQSAYRLQFPLLECFQELFLMFKDAEEGPLRSLPVDANPMGEKLRRACEMLISNNAEFPLRSLLSTTHKIG